MKSQRKINVYIITGFLGSGKTTVLNNMLSQLKSGKNTVIENEFGKINIDALLIEGRTENIYELTNGCICCSMSNQLLETLSRIAEEPQQPDNVIIETTGIADAGEIAGMFNMLYVSEVFRLKNVITVVDAQNVMHCKDINREVVRQIAAGDTIIVNKSELVSKDILQRIFGFVRSANPFAVITASAHGEIDLMDSSPRLTIQKTEQRKEDAQASNHHKIKTVLYEPETPFNIQILKYELFRIMYLYYNQIYRIKGFVSDDKGAVYLVQTAGKTIQVNEVRSSRTIECQLVFIGQDIELKSVQRLLARAVKKESGSSVAN